MTDNKDFTNDFGLDIDEETAKQIDEAVAEAAAAAENKIAEAAEKAVFAYFLSFSSRSRPRT